MYLLRAIRNIEIHRAYWRYHDECDLMAGGKHCRIICPNLRYCNLSLLLFSMGEDNPEVVQKAHLVSCVAVLCNTIRSHNYSVDIEVLE